MNPLTCVREDGGAAKRVENAKIEHLLAILYTTSPAAMILTQCAACAKPLAHDAPRRGAGVQSTGARVEQAPGAARRRRGAPGAPDPPARAAARARMKRGAAGTVRAG